MRRIDKIERELELRTTIQTQRFVRGGRCNHIYYKHHKITDIIQMILDHLDLVIEDAGPRLVKREEES